MVIRLGIVAADRMHLQVALAGLVAIDRALLKLYGGTVPPLYESGVVYRPESPDEWESLDILLARGYGDCEDLAAWRAAELQQAGVQAFATVYNVRANKWHAVVRMPDGTTEDPSRRLGMDRYRRRA